MWSGSAERYTHVQLVISRRAPRLEEIACSLVARVRQRRSLYDTFSPRSRRGCIFARHKLDTRSPPEIISISSGTSLSIIVRCISCKIANAPTQLQHRVANRESHCRLLHRCARFRRRKVAVRAHQPAVNDSRHMLIEKNVDATCALRFCPSNCTARVFRLSDVSLVQNPASNNWLSHKWFGALAPMLRRNNFFVLYLGYPTVRGHHCCATCEKRNSAWATEDQFPGGEYGN